MDVRIYTPNMELVGIVQSQTSLLWTRRYQSAGEFELICPITPNNIKLIHRGNLVWVQGKKEAGIIESVSKRESITENRMVIKGEFLEGYMGRRLIRPFYSCSNKLIEVAMREILSQAEPIPRVQLGELQGFTERITFQATYKNLLKYEEKLAVTGGYGFRFTPNFTEKTITFEIYKGVDRSLKQSTNHRVIFSDAYNNIDEASYDENDLLYKNICYVGGRGEGSERTIVIAGDDSLTGLERREMFLSASDITSDNVTESEYEAALLQRGYEALEKNNLAASFECETAQMGNFKYLTDYDIGDVVSVSKSNWGVNIEQRLTEITEIYEDGGIKVSPTFGTTLPSSIDWSDN